MTRFLWLICVGVGLPAACLADTTTGATRQRVSPDVNEGLGTWMFHIDGGRFTENIQLLAVAEDPDSDPPLRLSTIPSLNWQGQRTHDLEFRTSVVGRTTSDWECTLVLKAGGTARLWYDILGDTALGHVEVWDNPGHVAVYDLFGVRVPSGALRARSIWAPPVTP